MYKLWFYFDDKIHTEVFGTFDDMEEFVINYDVEVFKYEQLSYII